MTKGNDMADELVERLQRARLYAQDTLDNCHLPKGDGSIGNVMGIRDEIDAALARLSRPSTAPDTVMSAMRLLVHHDAAQYLMANLRRRSDGALKAHKHAALTTAYVAVMRNVDPDVVRRHHEAEYAAVHDTTADELTSRLDEAIGFDLDGYVDDDLTERFFLAFHKIAMRSLTHPSPQGGAEPDGRDFWLHYDQTAGEWCVENEPPKVIRLGAEIIHTREVTHPIGETGDTDELVERGRVLADSIEDKFGGIAVTVDGKTTTVRGWVDEASALVTRLRAERDEWKTMSVDRHDRAMNAEHAMAAAESSLAAERLKVAELTQLVADYEEVNVDKKRLAREIDVAMHGEEGAAKQASLCDLVEPARHLRERVAALVGALTEASISAKQGAAYWNNPSTAAAFLATASICDATLATEA